MTINDSISDSNWWTFVDNSLSEIRYETWKELQIKQKDFFLKGLET